MIFHSILVERVFKFVGSVPQGDDIKRKDLLVSNLKHHLYIVFVIQVMVQ